MPGRTARATDVTGRTQPLVTPYDDGGYFFDAVVRAGGPRALTARVRRRCDLLWALDDERT